MRKNLINCYQGNTKPRKGVATDNATDFGCQACQYILDDISYTCSSFVGLTGKHPQTGEDLQASYKCAEAWQPILMVEQSMQMRTTTEAIASMRNELVDRQDSLLHVVAGVNKAAKPKQIEEENNG